MNYANHFQEEFLNLKNHKNTTIKSELNTGVVKYFRLNFLNQNMLARYSQEKDLNKKKYLKATIIK